jgi:hypothetical protein
MLKTISTTLAVTLAFLATQLNAADYGAADIDTMRQTSQENRLRYERDFQGRSIRVIGTFKGLNEHVFGDELWVDFGVSGSRSDVHCVLINRRSPLADLLIDANLGDQFSVSGIISIDFFGALEVSDCNIQPV